MAKPIDEIDGARFEDLEGFWNEVSERLIPGADWGRNRDAFNDILRGGFGTPDDGFILRPTLFDILVEIIRTHGSGGDEAEDGVELQLA